MFNIFKRKIIEDSSRHFNVLIDTFFVKEYQENTKITESTKKHAQRALYNIKMLMPQGLHIEQLNYGIIEDFKGKLQNKYSQSHAKITFSIFKRFLSFLYLNSYLDKEVVFNDRLSSKPKPKTETVSENQMQYFKKKIKQSLAIDTTSGRRKLEQHKDSSVMKLYYSVIFLYSTGVRLQELHRIKHKHFNEKECKLYIPSFSVNKGQGRTIILNETARQILNTMPKYDKDFIFPYRSTQLLNTFWYRFCKKDYKKSHKFKLMDLRKAFISNALAQGFSLEAVSKYVGHSSSQVTSVYYSNSETLITKEFKKLKSVKNI